MAVHHVPGVSIAAIVVAPWLLVVVLLLGTALMLVWLVIRRLRAAKALLEAAIHGELPDESGRFGPFGGRYVPETLVPAFERLEEGVYKHLHEESFQAEFHKELREWVGRPTALTYAPRLSKSWGADVWLKREDLAHTGAHKINNTIGQALLTVRMGKKRVIAETGAGQHGVATATVCALFGMECVVYMGEEDIRRQRPNVYSMKLLGCEVRPVHSGSRTLRDAVNEAFRDWMCSVETTHYCLGSVVGPHPFPMIVRDFQSVIGKEARRQILDAEGRETRMYYDDLGRMRTMTDGRPRSRLSASWRALSHQRATQDSPRTHAGGRLHRTRSLRGLPASGRSTGGRTSGNAHPPQPAPCS